MKRRRRRAGRWLVAIVLFLALGVVAVRLGIENGNPPLTTKHQYSPPPAAKADPPLLASVNIKVPGQNQHPQLANGCEMTSLSMLLTAVGHPLSKMTLAGMIAKDPTPLVRGPGGKIISWGNPNVGFVGSESVYSDGFGVYHHPVYELLNHILPGRAVDLTGAPVSAIERQLDRGVPVMIWVNTTLAPTNLFWVTWQTPEGPFTTTLDEHVVLVVGYNSQYFYINNPLTGQADQPVPRANLIGAWRQLGEQAISVKPG